LYLKRKAMTTKDKQPSNNMEDVRVLTRLDSKKDLPKPLELKVSETDTIGRFGKHEVEVSAGRLIRFLQLRNAWTDFSYGELMRFYEAKGWNPDTILYGLHGNWGDDAGIYTWRRAHLYIAQNENGRLFVTDFFVRQCMEK
jgi:hypothetical protein